MANKIYPGYSNSSATLHDDGDETPLGGPDTKQSQIHSNAIPGEIPDSNNSLHEPKTRGGGREYLHVVRPGELVAAGALPGVEVVHADQTSDGLASASTDGRLLPAAGSAVRSRPRTDYKRKGNMPDGPTPRANAVKYTSEVIGADNSPQENGFCAIILTALSYILVIMFFPFSLCATIKVVQEYERAVIFRLGRLLPGGAKGPGIFFVMPCIEEYSKVDLRTVSFDVPPQEVLTRDSVTVSVDAVVYYRISSPTVSVANVENAANSTQLLAQTTLRNVLGTQNLSEILSNREHISEQMQNVLDDATDKWGIKVERVEIKDVRLPTQLQRAMAAEAEAARDARAKVIAAEGEQKASFALKEAADIIGGSPAALQLRYLQTLNSISAEKNSTIIFPVPIDFITGVIKN